MAVKSTPITSAPREQDSSVSQVHTSNLWTENYVPTGVSLRRSRMSMWALNAAINLLVSAGPRMARIGPLRRLAVNFTESRLASMRDEAIHSGLRPPGAEDDRYDIGRAILHTGERALADDRLSPASRQIMLRTLVRDILLLQGNLEAKEGFRQRHGAYPPDFMLVSPGKACNLRCVGCYADSGANREKLDWAVLDRLIGDAHDRLGNRFFVISGGEPLAYKSDGKGVLDLAERYRDSLFLMYTNGTLIDDDVARRMGSLGNITPAVSVEGLRERTEQRRGRGRIRPDPGGDGPAAPREGDVRRVADGYPAQL